MEQTNTGNAFEWAKFLAKHRASGAERFWRMVKAAPIPVCRSEPGWWIMHVEAEGRGDFTPEDFQRAVELKGKPVPRPLIPALPGVISLSLDAEGWKIRTLPDV